VNILLRASALAWGKQSSEFGIIGLVDGTGRGVRDTERGAAIGPLWLFGLETDAAGSGTVATLPGGWAGSLVV